MNTQTRITTNEKQPKQVENGGKRRREKKCWERRRINGLLWKKIDFDVVDCEMWIVRDFGAWCFRKSSFELIQIIRNSKKWKKANCLKYQFTLNKSINERWTRPLWWYVIGISIYGIMMERRLLFPTNINANVEFVVQKVQKIKWLT